MIDTANKPGPLPLVGERTPFESGQASGIRRLAALARRFLKAGSAPPPTPLLIAVDAPAAGSILTGNEEIVGWAAGSSPVVRVEILCDGERIRVGGIGHPRPDVAAAHPTVPDADRSGFALGWSTASIPAGHHVISVRAVDARGHVAEALVGSVVVEVVETPLRLQVDQPSLDGARVYGTVAVTGWAAGPVRVLRIEMLCDGEPVSAGSVGLARHDVVAEYPGLPDADRSGFALEWNTTTLLPGPHRLTVRAVDTRGQVAEVAGHVEVEPPIQLQVDEPSSDRAWVSGLLRVSGWAAGPHSIVRVEVLCDGEVVGVTKVDLARHDVAAARPDLAEAAHSGFRLDLESSPRLLGLREIAVRAIDARERVATVTRRLILSEHQPLGTEVARRAVRQLEWIRPSGTRERRVKRPDCIRFALYTSSLGNYFFGEIRDLLAAGLRELGFTVDIRDERYGFGDDADWHIVVAPHEFFYLGTGQGLLREDAPEHLILLNTEQPSTEWFSLALDCFAHARAIWDINLESSRFIVSRGHESSFLPLGYSSGFASAAEVPELPDHYGTCFLEPEIRRYSGGLSPLADRPLDVLFVGHASRRRERFFAKAAAALSPYRCYLHLSSVAAPVIPGQTTHMDTATVIGLAQRSKILLNIHHGEEQYFEWHRVVIEGLWQRALVITEPCGIASPFQAGVDFVEVPLEEIPKTIGYYLSSDKGRREADEIARHGFRTLRDKCRLVDGLRDLILELHDVPRFPDRFLSGVRDGHASAVRSGPSSPAVADTAPTAEIRSARERLLESGKVSDEERRVLSTISVEVHPADEMYVPGKGSHYISVGLSASRCVRAALHSAGTGPAVAAVLDFPCGYGRVLRFLRAMFPDAEIAAGEIQDEALDFCQREFSADVFRSSTDFERLSFHKKFDLIWCGSLITHLDDKAAVDLLGFFRRHLAERGVCVFTTHGRCVEEWMRAGKNTYGLSEEGLDKVLKEFDRNGYGYADYPDSPGYGISLTSHSRVVELAKCAGAWDEVLYLEQGWDDHHDVYAFTARVPDKQ